MLDLIWTERCAACGGGLAALVCDRCAPGAPHRAPARAAGVAGVLALGAYEGPLGRALRRAKYRPDRAVAVALADRLAVALAPVARRADALVPVPTPALRRASRGFGLPELLAAALAERSGVPVVHALAVRYGTAQASRATAEERRRNLAGRIRSVRPVRGRVLVVDDVLTTGATVEACARELLGDATDEVWAAVVCAVRDPQLE